MGLFIGIGVLSDISATDIGDDTKGAVGYSGIDLQLIDQVAMGNVMQTSEDAMYFARHIALKTGLPIDTPALTVNRLYGSA